PPARATGVRSSRRELNANTAYASRANAPIPGEPSRVAPVTLAALAATDAATAPEIINAGKLATAEAMPIPVKLWPASSAPNRVPGPIEHHGTLLGDRKSTRLNSSHVSISYAVFCLKKKKKDLRSAPLSCFQRNLCIVIYGTYR